jgi:hypothetical protein
MKRLLLLLTLVAITAGLCAWPVRIQSWDLDKDIKTLNQNRFSIDYVNRTNGVIHVYVRDTNEEDKLFSLGFTGQRMPDLAREYALQLWEETKDTKDPMRAYFTLDEYNNFMQQTAAQYPNLCQLVQFGTSVQGRPLYFLKITDNPSQEENEPELKYVGSIHGDEVVGYDMLIRLIQLLTSQYGTNTRITNIVNNTEIWINPMFNPDGNALVQRYNANGVDLNRNFPTPTGNQHPDGYATQVENIAMMDFSNAHDFDLSINFHGGSLVINYPWDYTYTLAPDDALLHEMALTYSRQNTPMYNSTEFPQGVTNGAAWYVIDGGMQDWNYFYTDCFELTGEISNVKWPPASQLDTFWAQNQESLLQYLEFAQRGVHGLVTDPDGTPLQANITVAGNAKVVKTDLPLGDYHRLLLPGTYEITASATGYISQSVTVTVPAGGNTFQDFCLAAAQLTNCKGQIRDLQGNPVSGATVSVQTNPLITLQSDAQGLFQLNSIYEGSYPIMITASGFAAFLGTLNVDSDYQNNNIIVLQQPLFTDNFENGMGNWTATGNWGIVSNSGSNVLTDSPTGNYSNNQNRTCRLTNPLSMNGVSNASLSFRCKYALENGYDFVYVEASPDNSTWTQLGSFTGTQSAWTMQYFSLNSYTSGNLYLRFRLATDTSQTADGIYIDDLQISGINSNVPVYGDINGNGIINNEDIQAILDYAVGGNPLPDMDPVPWETYRITNANADADQEVSAFDGYLIMKATSDPFYRLPVQSGIPEAVNDPLLNVEFHNETLTLRFIYGYNLRSVQLTTYPAQILDTQFSPEITGISYTSLWEPEERFAFIVLDSNDTQELNITVPPDSPSFLLIASINGTPSTTVQINPGSAVQDEQIPMLQTALLPNLPNPFNPSTTLFFTLSEPSQKTELCIYNLKGQKVRSILKEALPEGKHSVVWDGKDESGKAVGSGVYFVRLSANERTDTRKILLSK